MKCNTAYKRACIIFYSRNDYGDKRHNVFFVRLETNRFRCFFYIFFFFLQPIVNPFYYDFNIEIQFPETAKITGYTIDSVLLRNCYPHIIFRLFPERNDSLVYCSSAASTTDSRVLMAKTVWN